MSGPTQHAEARKAERMDPPLAASVAREPIPVAGLGTAGTGQVSSVRALMPSDEAPVVPHETPSKIGPICWIAQEETLRCLQTGGNVHSVLE